MMSCPHVLKTVTGLRQMVIQADSGSSSSGSSSSSRRRSGAFSSSNHINIVADASIHSNGHDCFVGAAYTWEYDTCAYCDFQYLISRKHLHPNEADLKGEIAILQKTHQLERVATYREIQAISAMVQSLSGGTASLDDYRPTSFLLRPVDFDSSLPLLY